MLRKIFGAKRDEVTGEWRKLHNTELHALYSSPDIIRNIKSRRLRWARHVAHMGESRNAYRVLVGRSEGIRSLGRPRRRWEDNIKMDLREVGYDDRYWINLAQDRDQWRAYVRAGMNLRSSTRVCVRNCVSSRRPEFECSGPQLEGPEFECSGPQLEGPEFEYNELSLKVILRRFINILDYLVSEWDEGDNAGEMSPWSSTESYPAFAHIGLRENPGKKPQPANLPRPGIEPGPPGFMARCANRFSTNVDNLMFDKVSANLQKPTLDLLRGCKRLESLVIFTANERGNSEKYEERTKRLSEKSLKSFDDSSDRRQTKKQYADGNTLNETVLKGRKNIEVETFW
ncbi:hypothetical protein ANN_21452 [Periplaneta americana]|uniref:Uncharacterized protein n=1 Tax=Periplaneta americana TaxID=6978 RepID=A0ABQ8SFP1_PERAM|nr:hypothetical protein ANN_21452 [Periplaneta americana]